MKVLIVCVSGITSDILSKKLNLYAMKYKKNIQFQSVGYRDLSVHIQESGIVFITPQVKSFQNEIIEICFQNQTPYIFLENKSMYSIDEEEIFHIIDEKAIRREKKVRQIIEQITIKDWLDIYKKAFLRVQIPLCLGIVMYFLNPYFHFYLINILYEITGKVFCVYLALSLGYEYAQKTNRTKNRMSIFALGCLFVATTSIERTPSLLSDTLTKKYIFTEYISIEMIPLTILIVTFSLMLYGMLLNKKRNINNIVLPDKVTLYLSGVIQEGSVFAVILVLRCLLFLCL